MNKLYIFILSFFLISCDSMQTIVEVEIPPHEPVLVLNGKLDTDTIIHVMLSHSVGAFDDEIPNCIIDAEVLLYKDNALIDTLIIDLENSDYIYYWSNTGEDSLLMYYYKSNYVPTGGHLYKIIASHSDYKTIEANTFIPNNLEIFNLEIDTNSSELVQFNFSFIDDPNNRNYYELELYANCSKVWDEEEYDYSGNVTIFQMTLHFLVEFHFQDILTLENLLYLQTHYSMVRKRIFLLMYTQMNLVLQIAIQFY